jgi:hypothetical protein
MGNSKGRDEIGGGKHMAWDDRGGAKACSTIEEEAVVRDDR